MWRLSQSIGEGWSEKLGVGDVGIEHGMDNNKALLYSTQEYIQYPIKSHNGKQYMKKNVCVCVCVCVYISESFCCTAEINTL